MHKLKHYMTHFQQDCILFSVFQRHLSLADPLMFHDNHRNLTLLHGEGLNVLHLPGFFHKNHRRIPLCSFKQGLIKIMWIFLFKSTMIDPDLLMYICVLERKETVLFARESNKNRVHTR